MFQSQKRMMNLRLFNYFIIAIISLALSTVPVKSETPGNPETTEKSNTTAPGESTMQPRIAVKDVKFGEFPYVVSLRLKRNREHFCGGSVLNESFIITAAHCMYNNAKKELKPRNFFIVAGQTELELDATGITRNIKTIIKHPYFENNKHLNDIALLHLNAPLPNTKLIKPILLNEKEVVGGLNCTVVGWGALAYSDTHEDSARVSIDTLKKDEFITMIRETCAKQFAEGPYRSFFTENTFCTTSHAGVAKPQEYCQVADDSGGPLICNGSLTGIVSYVTSCEQRQHPAIYTDVSKHLMWIKYQKRPAGGPAYRKDPSHGSSSPKQFCDKYLSLLIIVIAFKF